MDKIQILIVGPVDGHGGIASVIRSILHQGFSEKYSVRCLNTLVPPGIGLKHKAGSICSIVIKAFTLLSNRNIKIVHIHTSAGFSFIRKSVISLIAHQFSKKVILHLHASRFYDYYINQTNPFLRLYIRFVLRRVDCVVSLCRDWKNKIERLGVVKNVQVLNNPVSCSNAAVFDPNQNEKTNGIKLLFMGEFERRKGIIDLLEAAVMLKKKKNDFTLFLCGKGTLNTYIDRFINAMALSENIVNCGWVSGETKKSLLSKTDIFILPSYNEGVPIAILEAFCYGIPVISTKISGIPEIVTNDRNGILITPGDQIGLYHNILQLMDNPELRHRFGYNNLLDVKRYDVKNVVQQWQTLYASLA